MDEKGNPPPQIEPARTTIVGGGRPQDDVIPRRIPRGLEVLIKKAAVDPAFKKVLFEKRARAAEAIALTLSPPEEAMLEAVPEAQLEAIVANTKVNPKLRPAFLGYAAKTMLAALGATLLVCRGNEGERTEEKREPGRAARNRLPSENRSLAPDASEREYVYSGIGYGAGVRPGRFRNRESAPGKPRVLYRCSAGVRPGPEPEESTEIETDKERRVYRVKRLSRDVVAFVRKNLSAIQSAYDAAVERSPSLGGGKIVAKFTVSGDGTVTEAQILSDTVGDAFLNTSVLKTIQSWRFPKGPGDDVNVVYPFVFIAEEV